VICADKTAIQHGTLENKWVAGGSAATTLLFIIGLLVIGGIL